MIDEDEEFEEFLCYILGTIKTCKELTQLVLMRLNENGYGYEFYMGGG